MSERMAAFRMPQYREIPNIGLYLEQTVKYINTTLAPLGAGITPSMLSNYVKQGYVDRPIKKQYYPEQIAHLLFIVLAKQVLSMDSIKTMIALREQTCTAEAAYAYFCSELEMALDRVMNGEDVPPEADAAPQRRLLRSLVIALAYISYLNRSLTELPPETE